MKQNKTKLSKFLYFIFFIMLFTFNGCVSYRHSVNVSSYSTNENVGRKYFLQVSEKKLKDKTIALQVQEFEKYIDIVLAQRGYIKVDNIKNADQYIVFDYDISAPQTRTYSYEEPVYDTVLRPYTRYKKIDGVYYPYTHWEREYEVVGYRTRVGTRTFYSKNIYINSFNRTKTKNIWQISGNITDGNGDLRYAFPYLVKGISGYIGTNSRQIINVVVPDDDLEVQMMKKGEISTSAVAK